MAGVDGSENSLAALDVAAEEAHIRGLPLHIVHGFIGSIYSSSIAPTIVPGAEEAARQLTDDAASRVRQNYPDLVVQTHVLAGGEAAVIIDKATATDLVVVGSRGRGGFTSLLAGSVSTQVATHAPGPVIVVRPAPDAARSDSRGHVVVGVDATAGCVPAVDFAFAEAALHRVPLTAIHIWSHLPVTELTADVPVSYSYAQAREDATRIIAASIAGWVEKYPDVEVRQDPILSENPGKELVEASKHASLVVVGSRGRGELTSALLGSVGYTLLHHAHCVVAIAR
jgi:nucleotide-binding universal stress UspA family protein